MSNRSDVELQIYYFNLEEIAVLMGFWGFGVLGF